MNAREESVAWWRQLPEGEPCPLCGALCPTKVTGSDDLDRLIAESARSSSFVYGFKAAHDLYHRDLRDQEQKRAGSTPGWAACHGTPLDSTGFVP